MPEIAAFQRDFVQAVFQSDGMRDAFAIYRNTTQAGIIDALAANYPVTRELVGDGMFAAIGGDFARAYPPSSPILATYGAKFAGWITKQPWIRDLPYLPDVARCERMHTQSLFAADADPVEASALAETPPELWNDLRLHLHPATQFTWFTGPAMRIWLAHRADCADLGAIEWRPEGALFTRPSLHVTARTLGDAEQCFLSGVARGESVGAAAIAASEHYPESDFGRIFICLLNEGGFAAPQPMERIMDND